MAKRTAAPALYELIRSRRIEPLRRPEPRVREKPPKPPREGGSRDWLAWLSAGRAIRTPVGYILLSVAGGLLVVVGAYVFGYTRAGRVEPEDGVVQSPSDAHRRPGPEAPIEVSQAPPVMQAVVPTTVPSLPSQRAPAAPAGRPQIFGDPRVPGKSYFVIAETNTAGADRLARYCRSQDLEAYVIGADDDRFRKVIVLPGFDPLQRSSPAVKALEDRIHEVGDRWKSAERGASNLRDAYPLQFKGDDKKA